jgi:hypothetical protein
MVSAAGCSGPRTRSATGKGCRSWNPALVCDLAPACAQNKCPPARDRPRRESAGALAFGIQLHDGTGHMGTQLNVASCDFARSWLTRAETPICID